MEALNDDKIVVWKMKKGVMNIMVDVPGKILYTDAQMLTKTVGEQARLNLKKWRFLKNIFILKFFIFFLMDFTLYKKTWWVE